MNDQEKYGNWDVRVLEKLYGRVLKHINSDPHPYNATSLWDWLAEGEDIDTVTPEQIAREWDEVNELSSE